MKLLKSLFVSGILLVLLTPCLFSSGNPEGEAVVKGISFVSGEINPRGNFEKVYYLKRSQEEHFVPADLLAMGHDEKTLNIFHFNDLHGHITDLHKTKGNTHRISQMVRLLKEAKQKMARDAVTIFVSAGDEHTGTIFDELSGWDEASFYCDPAYEILSKAGLDASVIGNHEVDRGYAIAAKAVEESAGFPVLSANIFHSKYLTDDIIYPAIIGIVDGLRIGIVGLTTPDETRQRTVDDPDVFVGNPLNSLEYYVERMDEFVDVFVILSHIGNEHEVRHNVRVGEQSIAKILSRITQKPAIIIGGHTHSELNKNNLEMDNLINNVIIAQAGAYGSWLGHVSMRLTRSSSGDAASEQDACLLPIKIRDDRIPVTDEKYGYLEHDEDFDSNFEVNYIQPLLVKLDKKMNETLGHVSNDTGFSPQKVITDRYVGECGMANFMNDTIVGRSEVFPGGRVDFAAFNASGLAGGVVPGSICTYADWFSVMPYADNIVIYELRGYQIYDILKSNAKRLVRPEEVNDTDLSGFVSRGFLHFSKGIRYTIVLNDGADTALVNNVFLNGRPINEVLNTSFRVAFSSYISNGFEGWKRVKIGAGLPDNIVGWDLAKLSGHDTGLIYRNEIIASIRESGSIHAFDGRSSLYDGRLQIVQRESE
ncbi:5'-nucleotidase C-terminal domain-containing protein [Marispirochaeta sp.]|uniref:bifunctional metallophosphatase/5'-nucleotidase n=1 Tax=Marispirochaeta sp. TaxID=2038653 RepID=UPI0029C86FE3|nr:5'-nucleotidase C-terminal domain-containing protein [Marispirochaeta sp.]